ncbi:MAG TPA: efflux RND transporter periplasmic adaptor subunit [Chitinophagales bacterium]|nr:efflux RND transporter periplasmic adaptor subunit [Chitinophagales bacterium]
MKNSIKIITTIIISFIGLNVFISCETAPIEETQISFSMSDSTYNRCEFVEVTEEVVKDRIRLFGKIAADNNSTAQVFPFMSGVVKSVNVELGDYVKQGQLLATIESGEVANYQKKRLNAINKIAITEKNLQVAKDLYEGKLNSEKDVLSAQSKLDKANAQLNRINEVYSIYQLKSGSTYNITAPISGFIVSKNINQNEMLRDDVEESIFSVANINEVWVLANVNESDISRIQVGHDVEIKTIAYPDNIYKGKIDKIFNAIDPISKSMKVRVKVPNTDLKLKPEMNCTVNVFYSESESMSTVPSSAIIFDKNKHWLMVFKDKQNIETRMVKVYRQLGETSYIESGIQLGETVISKNGLLIYDAINN